eukprot:TRINITY_DN50126_c0_g1_i1.p1 TRINITY_DN50126_c0_g1~~TRINITY_DN50126_c0_g1_i1.p1  ORF type:complete len:548 (+),score=109.17 TRINITY_DN50126_c0_g1_i1:71-1714(+)
MTTETARLASPDVGSQRGSAPLWMLGVMVAFSACAQYDSGAIAALEATMSAPVPEGGFGFSTKNIGIINALEYIMLPVACPIILSLLNNADAKVVLLGCLLGNLGGVVLLCFAPDLAPPQAPSSDEAENENATWNGLFAVMLVSRAISGICHAGIAVYGNVWVDAFAPPESAASWLGAIPISSLLGLVTGFAVAGYSDSWKFSLLVNSLWFLVVFGILLMTPAKYIVVDSRPTDGAVDHQHSSGEKRLSFVGAAVDGGAAVQAVPSKAATGSFVAVESIRRNSIDSSNAATAAAAAEGPEAPESLLLYGLLGLAVSALFFVSGGLQFWCKPYMEQLYMKTGAPITSEQERKEREEAAQSLTVSLVLIITLTAPTIGALSGGAIVDKLGGYRSAAARHKALSTLVVMAVLVGVIGFISCFVESFWVAAIGFWFFNLTGASVLPGTMGIMMAAVRQEWRPAASAGSQVMINLLGMAAGAFVPGMIAGRGEGETVNYPLGLRSLLIGPVIGFVMILAALLVAGQGGDARAVTAAGQRPGRTSSEVELDRH